MIRKISSKFLLGIGTLVVVALLGVGVAQGDIICHHGASATNDSADYTANNDQNAHVASGGNHSQDHPPVEGTCQLDRPTASPEPLTMLLFGAGLAGVGYAAKRRKQRAE